MGFIGENGAGKTTTIKAYDDVNFTRLTKLFHETTPYCIKRIASDSLRQYGLFAQISLSIT